MAHRLRSADGQRLARAGWVFAAGSALHLFDHLRRGQDSVTEELYWAGNLALVLQVIVITLAVTRHPKAAVVAAPAGFALALAFLAAHWLPEWSSLSDPFIEGDTAVFSWFASAAEIAGALAVGLVAWPIARRAGRRRPSGTERQAPADGRGLVARQQQGATQGGGHLGRGAAEPSRRLAIGAALAEHEGQGNGEIQWQRRI